MKITIYKKNLELTDKLYDYVNEKIGKLEKYLDNAIECWVELDQDKSMRSGKKYRCEVQIKVPRGSLRAEEVGFDIFETIDLIEPKLKKEIERYKDKRQHKRGIKGIVGK